MMYARRNRKLVLAEVIGLRDGASLMYPACQRCYTKVFSDSTSQRYSCLKCGESYSDRVSCMRYKLSLTVTDTSDLCSITVFGRTLDGLFGISASGLSRMLDEIKECYEGDTEELLCEAVRRVMIGKMFYFGFQSAYCLQKDKKANVCLKDILRQEKSENDLKNNVPELVAIQMIAACGSTNDSFWTVVVALNHLLHQETVSGCTDQSLQVHLKLHNSTNSILPLTPERNEGSIYCADINSYCDDKLSVDHTSLLLSCESNDVFKEGANYSVNNAISSDIHTSRSSESVSDMVAQQRLCQIGGVESPNHSDMKKLQNRSAYHALCQKDEEKTEPLMKRTSFDETDTIHCNECIKQCTKFHVLEPFIEGVHDNGQTLHLCQEADSMPFVISWTRLTLSTSTEFTDHDVDKSLTSPLSPLVSDTVNLKRTRKFERKTSSCNSPKNSVMVNVSASPQRILFAHKSSPKHLHSFVQKFTMSDSNKSFKKQNRMNQGSFSASHKCQVVCNSEMSKCSSLLLTSPKMHILKNSLPRDISISVSNAPYSEELDVFLQCLNDEFILDDVSLARSLCGSRSEHVLVSDITTNQDEVPATCVMNEVITANRTQFGQCPSLSYTLSRGVSYDLNKSALIMSQHHSTAAQQEKHASCSSEECLKRRHVCQIPCIDASEIPALQCLKLDNNLLQSKDGRISCLLKSLQKHSFGTESGSQILHSRRKLFCNDSLVSCLANASCDVFNGSDDLFQSSCSLSSQDDGVSFVNEVNSSIASCSSPSLYRKVLLRSTIHQSLMNQLSNRHKYSHLSSDKSDISTKELSALEKNTSNCLPEETPGARGYSLVHSEPISSTPKLSWLPKTHTVDDLNQSFSSECCSIMESQDLFSVSSQSLSDDKTPCPFPVSATMITARLSYPSLKQVPYDVYSEKRKVSQSVNISDTSGCLEGSRISDVSRDLFLDITSESLVSEQFSGYDDSSVINSLNGSMEGSLDLFEDC